MLVGHKTTIEYQEAIIDKDKKLIENPLLEQC